MDASVVPLCLSLFDWAAYRKRKGGLKLHTILEYDGLLPVFCHGTDAKTHEVTVARQHTYPKGSVLVFDRGYYDFEWFNELHSSRVFFITRTKSNLDYRIAEEREILHQDKDVVLGDYVDDIYNPKAREVGIGQLRLVWYYDTEQQREFEFLTNSFILPTPINSGDSSRHCAGPQGAMVHRSVLQVHQTEPKHQIFCGYQSQCRYDPDLESADLFHNTSIS